jgi:hypothetical protein
VPFNLLAASSKHAAWVTPAQLIDLYADQPECPRFIDLTGGQPDIVPEWVPWMMQELQSRDLDQSVYLWSDDNLSNDYFWIYLTDADRELVATYRNYGRVCCFKGFNAQSFSFNTLARPELFDQQFNLFERLLRLGIDLYAYVTLTTPSPASILDDMARFVDRLQSIHPNLPLRTVPLEIEVYSPVAARMKTDHFEAIKHQHVAVAAWQNELSDRFTSEERSMCITEISLGLQHNACCL